MREKTLHELIHRLRLRFGWDAEIDLSHINRKTMKDERKEKIIQALQQTAQDFDRAARSIRDQVEELKREMKNLERINEKLKK